jgi:RNA polymerase sigma-70 factor (ECF subfamily)
MNKRAVSSWESLSVPENSRDEQLLQRALGGDLSVFAELYDRHGKAVFRFAYRMLGSRELAEDITQDCFLSLIDHLDRFQPGRAALRTYLFAIARNIAINQLRRRNRELALDELSLNEEQAGDDAPMLAALMRAEIGEAVRETISSLPPLQREALLLFEFEELSLSEIAEIVGTDVGSVKARLHRARARLRQVFADYFAAKNSDEPGQVKQ